MVVSSARWLEASSTSPAPPQKYSGRQMHPDPTTLLLPPHLPLEVAMPRSPRLPLLDSGHSFPFLPGQASSFRSPTQQHPLRCSAPQGRLSRTPQLSLHPLRILPKASSLLCPPLPVTWSPHTHLHPDWGWPRNMSFSRAPRITAQICQSTGGL